MSDVERNQPQQHQLAAWRVGQRPKVTQRALGARIGVSRWMVNAIEKGRRYPGRDLIAKIKSATQGEVGLDAFTDTMAEASPELAA